MGKYIDWYLVELEMLLDDGLDPKQEHDFLAEAEAHLSQSAAELQATGLSEKDSELTALQRFGKARVIARETRGGRRVLTPSEGIFLFAFAAFGGVLAWFVGVQSHLGLGTWDSIMLCAPAGVFTAGAMFVRRVLWRELGILTGVGFVATILLFGIYFGAVIPESRSETTRYSQEISAQANGIANQIEILKRGMDTGSSPDLIYPSGILVNNRSQGLFVADGVRYAKAPSWEAAQAGWQGAGGYLAQLNRSLQDTRSLAAELSALGEASVLTSALSHVPLVGLYCMFWLAGALAVNILTQTLRHLTRAMLPLRKLLA